jgi:hypothetical protein
MSDQLSFADSLCLHENLGRAAAVKCFGPISVSWHWCRGCRSWVRETTERIGEDEPPQRRRRK